MKRLIPALICSAVFAAFCMTQTSSVFADSQTNVINVTDYGANGGDLLDDAPAIQEALDRAPGQASDSFTVRIPKGTYYISRELTIHSNTVLKLESGAKIVRLNGELPMLTNSDDSGCMAGGYSHASNITVTGGEWDGGAFSSTTTMLFSINHASDITVSNTYIHNFTDAHAVIFNACINVFVQNVSFADYICTSDDSSDWYQEALHIDYTAKEQKIVGRAAPLDDTPCRNVIVENCSFTNVAAGIGTHHDYSGLYEDGITVSKCRFNNVSYACINGYGFRSMSISGNTATNVVSFARLEKCSGEIVGNTVTSLSSASSSGHTIRISNSEVTVDSNAIKGSSSSGIAVLNKSGVQIIGNRISSVSGSGILVSSKSEVSSSGNTLSKCHKYGVYADGGAKLNMYSDSISGTGLAAVYLSKAASANLYDCTIDSSKTQGIYGKNTALTVDGCKISNSADDGIYAVSGSLKLRNSRIYDSGMRGVAVRNAQFSIVSNKIYSNGSSSVKIAGSAYGTLKSNLIGAKGISVSSSASVSRSGNKFRLSESKITLSKHKVRYTGKPIKPGIRVNFAGKTLREGRDYRIIYSDNTDCGTAKVTIKGIGKYSGSKTVNFTIK